MLLLFQACSSEVS